MTVRRGRGMLPGSAATSIWPPLGSATPLEHGLAAAADALSNLEHPPGSYPPGGCLLGARASNVRCCPVGGDADLAQPVELMTYVPGLAAAADGYDLCVTPARFRWLPRVPIQRARRAAGGTFSTAARRFAAVRRRTRTPGRRPLARPAARLALAAVPAEIASRRLASRSGRGMVVGAPPLLFGAHGVAPGLQGGGRHPGGSSSCRPRSRWTGQWCGPHSSWERAAFHEPTARRRRCRRRAYDTSFYKATLDATLW